MTEDDFAEYQAHFQWTEIPLIITDLQNGLITKIDAQNAVLVHLKTLLRYEIEYLSNFFEKKVQS